MTDPDQPRCRPWAVSSLWADIRYCASRSPRRRPGARGVADELLEDSSPELQDSRRGQAWNSDFDFGNEDCSDTCGSPSPASNKTPWDASTASARSAASSDSFSEAGLEVGGGIGSEVPSWRATEAVLEVGPGMRRVVPRRFEAWAAISMCILSIFVAARFMQLVHRTNGYTHTIPFCVIVAVSLCAHLALRVAGLVCEGRLAEHEEFLVLWSCLLSGLFAAVVCAKDPDQRTCEGIRYASAAPRVQVMQVISVLWSLVSQFPRWCVPDERLRTVQQLLAVVVLGACCLLAPLATYMLQTTSCRYEHGKATVWFALGLLVVSQILSGQIIRTLRTGVVTGFRVAACPSVMGLMFLGASVLHNDQNWGALCWTCSALVLCALVCGALATHVPEGICSTSPLYERRRDTASNNCLCSGLRSAKRFSKTWRGTFVLCTINSMISAWVYRPWVDRAYDSFYASMSEEERQRAVTPLHMGSAKRCCHIILVLASLSFCVSVVSILSDWYRQRNALRGKASPHLPIDRHFRCITALKSGMIVVKTDFLMMYSDPENFGGQTIMQAISIAITVICVNWGVINMSRAAHKVTHQFEGMFRHPVLLWRVSITCIFLWHLMNGILLLSAVLDAVGNERVFGVRVPSPQELSWLGVVLPLGSKWLYIGNELTLLLSSKLANPPVFAAVQSRQGVQIMVTVGAIGTPMVMLFKAAMWLYYCENRQRDMYEGGHWQVWVCMTVSMTFLIGALLAYASIG